MLAAEYEEEDGANGEKEKEDGQDNDRDEVGVEGVIHGGGDDGGKGEGGLEKGEVPQGCLPVFQTALYLRTQIELLQMASTTHLSQNIPTDGGVCDHWVEVAEKGSHLGVARILPEI